MQYLLFRKPIDQSWPLILRRFASNASPKRPNMRMPQIWLEQNHVTPPVNLVDFDGMQSPSALSWLRRRGPADLHHGHLYRMFRERAVRVLESISGKVKRVSRSRILSEGDVLLWPKSLGQAPAPFRASGVIDLSSEEAEVIRKQLILNWTSHFVFINKPAGLEVQGGQSGGQPSLKGLIDSGVLNLDPDDDLKLVHRLDKLVSGVIVLARGKDAAAYISRAFRDKSEEAVRSLAGDRLAQETDVSRGGMLCVDKTYEALVLDRDGRFEQGLEAKVSLPVPLSHWTRSSEAPPKRLSGQDEEEDDTALPSLTRYKVKKTFSLHQQIKLALLELSPLTGRRHQLRYHCAYGLNAPILGDVEYGHTPASIQRIRATIPNSSWKGRPLPIMLHSKSIELTSRASGELKASSTAPLPPHMQALCETLTEI
jgi:23S rRNA-/tRNA-specific pseudouridylate synthase